MQLLFELAVSFAGGGYFCAWRTRVAVVTLLLLLLRPAAAVAVVPPHSRQIVNSVVNVDTFSQKTWIRPCNKAVASKCHRNNAPSRRPFPDQLALVFFVVWRREEQAVLPMEFAVYAAVGASSSSVHYYHRRNYYWYYCSLLPLSGLFVPCRRSIFLCRGSDVVLAPSLNEISSSAFGRQSLVLSTIYGVLVRSTRTGYSYGVRSTLTEYGVFIVRVRSRSTEYSYGVLVRGTRTD